MDRYEMNTPSVAGEVIDGEAIIMHLGSGHYFSTDGSGALLWAGIEQKQDMAALADALVAAYAIGRDEAEAAAGAFVTDLKANDLIREAAGAGGEFSPPAIGGAYAPPRLQRYTDMQDLLLLDPIHDVDEVGWPVPAPVGA
ncbi:PqqD family protein [Sphingosinicella rhizophila]|uniref:PqqD family protein n=1 Tax=Sphingosinicella rhizophila TaxID=3050082 RepID=A0ABU3QC05_9SPHN|nr:PqqD family protein [Sphingosinicella sp. GR2756]MDT9600475.1 PqqD family protein [Sphingosinicella sp. GR2756]